MQKFIHHTVVGYVALLILLKMFAMPFACLEYAVNKEYISSTLCENRNRPEMHCDGQCHLKKQLTKTNDTSEAPGQKGANKSVSVDYFEEIKSITFGYSENTVLTFTLPANTRSIAGFHGNIFHPPIG